MEAWDLLVARDDLARTELVERRRIEPGPNQVLLRVDRVGVTANNVTYAQLGEDLRYWTFFPTDEGWGRVPLWGFAEVEDSNHPDVATGTRVYGYLPTSSHVIVRPVGVKPAGFRDGSEHRTDLPSAYNLYSDTAGDPSYEAELEDLQILYRPLFITSFMLDDFLADNDFFGAQHVVVSSASSKTAYATAFCMRLRDARPHLTALTSPRNVDFTSNLDCYDEVVTYAEVTTLPLDRPTLYMDLAGRAELRATIHDHFGAALVYDAVVGSTSREGLPSGSDELPGPEPAFFFAPDQIQKRRSDWGPGQIEKRYSVSWRAFVPMVGKWVDVVEGKGPEGLRDTWLEVLSGRSDPRAGHVVAL